MNKKLLVIIAAIAAMLVVGGGVFAAIYYGSTMENKKSATNEEFKRTEDVAIFYLDFGQLLDKSAIYEILGNSNRELLSTVFSANIEDRKWKSYAKELINDPAKSGLNIDKPLYGYVNIPKKDTAMAEVTVVVEVKDVKKVDKLFDFLSALCLQENDEPLNIVRNGDTRSLVFEGAVIGYNKTRLIITGRTENHDCDYDKMLNKALKRPHLNLAAYKDYDMAVDVNINKLLDIALISGNADLEYLKQEQQEYCYDEWEVEFYQELIDETKSQIRLIKSLKEQAAQHANVVAGLAFEDGCIIAEAKANGFNSEYKLDTKASNAHLQHIDSSVMAVLNMGVNGETLAKMIEENIDSKYADMLDMGRNEFNIMMGVLCDALESINGDLTLALEDVKAPHDNGAPCIEAVLSVDVKDDYIISNIAQYTAGLLNRVNDNCYSASFAGNNLVIMQNSDILQVDMNNTLRIAHTPATDATWFKDVEDSYGYFVINVDQIMRNPQVMWYYDHATYTMNDQEAQLMNDFIEPISYAYFSIPTPQSAKMVIVLDDKDTNSLEQIVKIVTPYVMQEVAEEIFRF